METAEHETDRPTPGKAHYKATGTNAKPKPCKEPCPAAQRKSKQQYAQERARATPKLYLHNKSYISTREIKVCTGEFGA